jgi:putrescine transport system ATP-binding protein
VIDCQDLQHYVGHGITGTAGMPVTVAVRPEKIHLSPHAPADEDQSTGFNRAKGVVKNLSYFGSFTVYHLELPSGRTLKISQNNTQRHREHELTWGSEAWAHWSRMSQVVLTQ